VVSQALTERDQIIIGEAKREPMWAQLEEFRDFQDEVEVQRREPYQNADVITNQLAADELNLPLYDLPP